MGVIVSNVAPSIIKPSGWLFIPMTSPLTWASTLSLSFFFFLNLNSLVYLEGWIWSMRTWILFLIIFITNQDTCAHLMQLNFLSSKNAYANNCDQFKQVIWYSSLTYITVFQIVIHWKNNVLLWFGSKIARTRLTDNVTKTSNLREISEMTMDTEMKKT